MTSNQQKVAHTSGKVSPGESAFSRDNGPITGGSPKMNKKNPANQRKSNRGGKHKGKEITKRKQVRFSRT